jgi:putative nucleotidyltransferase with HDIG domain
MLRLFKQKDILHPFLAWLIILLWYVILGNALFTGPRVTLRHLITAHSFWLFNQPPTEAEHITVVAIDQTSRRFLGLKWPWNRSVTAKLIRNIASYSPKVIGLDIVFSGASEQEEDDQLVSALQSHSRIVLGYILGKDSREKPLQKFSQAASSTGFIDKPLDEGRITKTRTFFIGDDGEPEYAIEIAILKDFYGWQGQDIKISERGILVKDEVVIPSPKGEIPLNYLLYHSNFNIVSASSLLDNRVNPSDFRDKIVLVGATDPVLHDEFPTPLGTFPGVTILGNSLVMLMSKRFLHYPFVLYNVLLVLFEGCLISLLSFSALAVTYVCFMYLRAQDIVFPYFSVLFAGGSAYASFNIYKYATLIYMSNRLKNQAVVDPRTGLYTARYFLLRLEENASQSQNLVFVGIRIENYQRLSLTLMFEEVTMLMNLFSDYFRRHVQEAFKKVAVACLSPDTLGILIEREERGSVELFLKKFFETSHVLEWKLGEKSVRTALKVCLIYKAGEHKCKKVDVIDHMENLFAKGSEGSLVIDNMQEGGGEVDKKISHKDIFDFIPYDWEERNKDLENSLRGVLEMNKRLNRLNWGTLTALARAIDAKSPWTAGHSERVTEHALKLGRCFKLTQEELDNLHRAGLLHDIGKIATPAEILDKPGKLTEEEYQTICEHPKAGARILEPIEDYAEIVPIVMQHHERFDGKGYPNSLAGENICLGARILAVADVFDALISERPYRAGMDADQAIAIIKEGSGSQFDPKMVETFLAMMPMAEEHPRADTSQVLASSCQKNQTEPFLQTR